MATPFESNAEEFVGARPSSASSSYEIPDAPKLSNSTRRMISAREVFAEQAYDSSLMARRENSMERQRVDMDAARSQLYDQDMERRRKEAEWYDREETRKQGLAAMDRISKLMPNSPTYLEEKSKIMGDLPMAGLDKNVAAVFETKDKIYDEAQKSREKAQELKVKSEDRVASREDNQAFQLDSSRIAREENIRNNIELKVADMSDEGQESYETLISQGKPPMEAFRAARLQDRGVVSIKEANMSNRMVQGYNRQISTAQAALDKIESDLTISDEEKEARGMDYRSQIADFETARDLEAAVLDAYWESKGGRPEPKSNSRRPTAQTPSKMSVKSLLPGSK
jgi:hypothetical protein